MQASNIVQFLKMLIKNKLSAEVNFRLEAFFFGKRRNIHPYCIKTEGMHGKNTAWLFSYQVKLFPWYCPSAMKVSEILLRCFYEY